MSVSTTHYIVYGYVFEGKLCKQYQEELEAVEELYYNNQLVDIDVIVDGMSGKYTVIGSIIKSGDEYDGFGFFELNPENLVGDLVEKVPNVVKTMLPNVDLPDIKLMIFTHYS